MARAFGFGIQLFRQDGCHSYILFDRASREAMLIDPRNELGDEYRAFIADNGLQIRYAVDTRLHTEHVSSAHVFKDENGCETVISHRAVSSSQTRKVRSGERLSLGKNFIQVLETPGAAPECISLQAEGMVFSGDALWIGATARTDLPGADPQAYWKSAHEVLGGLPRETIVYPGHDREGLMFSTFSIEKSRNPVFSAKTAEAYLRLPAQERDPVPAPASISVEKFSKKLEAGGSDTLFIDIREEGEFSEAHIPGMKNFPISVLGMQFTELSHAKRIYISCQTGRRSAVAAKTLSYVGFRMSSS